MRKFSPQEYIEVFRGLKLEHNANIGPKGNLWRWPKVLL